MRSHLLTGVSISVLFWASRPAAAQFYTQHNLVSDQPGVADHRDDNLVNAWGLVASATSPWWVANNGTGTSTLYNGHGVARSPVVTIPGGAPTGVVFNGGAGVVRHSPTPPAGGAPPVLFSPPQRGIPRREPRRAPPPPPPPRTPNPGPPPPPRPGLNGV